MFGKNIKVHFAGLDDNEGYYASLRVADVKYVLYSAYWYIYNKKPDSNFVLPENHMLKRSCREFKNVIQDSGVFTMMFGKDAGKKQTIETLTQWQDKLIEFIKQNNLNVMPVEIDCQKVLGVDEAWYFRERAKKLLPNHTHINVWHFEDGRKGLDRLIEFSDYIAIGLPEWRKVKGRAHKEQIKYVTHYIKNKKPEIDIHLLGCTDVKLLAENSFCTSADSTSWLSGVKFGGVKDGNKTRHVKDFDKNIFRQRHEAICQLYKNNGLKQPSGTLNKVNASICATLAKDAYTLAAGPQD